MLTLDETSIDKSLPVPVGTQLHGLLSYMLALGEFPPGTRLPSVRQLAARLSIAPMTVNQVYQDLREAGLIEMRQGSGAFVSRRDVDARESDRSLAGLRAEIETLIGKAEQLGVPTMKLVSMINAQAQYRRKRAGLDIVFAAIFEMPAKDYVAAIEPLLDAADSIRIVTLDMMKASDTVRQKCRAADLVVTFLPREAEVRSILQSGNVLGLRFIPSERTRQSLAGMDPRSRIAAVSYFKEYIAIMRPSVQEFAPHVSDIRVTWLSAPDLDEVIAASDAVVFASGADAVADRVPAGKRCFEYRHTPDPSALESILVPHMSELRLGKPARNGTANLGEAIEARPA